MEKKVKNVKKKKESLFADEEKRAKFDENLARKFLPVYIAIIISLLFILIFLETAFIKSYGFLVFFGSVFLGLIIAVASDKKKIRKK